MASDKQLINVKLEDVLEKRRLDQALNAKEFAVLAGISYSSARAWFRLPGFPAFCGVVFWQDFVTWRNAHVGADRKRQKAISTQETPSNLPQLSARASRLLAEA